MTTNILIGTSGYAVRVDDDAGAAILLRSTALGVSELSRFPFAEAGRRDAIAAAVLTAVQLEQLANDTTAEAPDAM